MADSAVTQPSVPMTRIPPDASSNPGAAVKYDSSNPYNLNPDGTPMKGTGNFGGPSSPDAPKSAPTPNVLPAGSTPTDLSNAQTNTGTVKTQDQIESDARAKAFADAQDRIKSIGDTFDQELKTELSAQADVNKQNQGRTEALSSLMGLGGSSTADTRSAVTTQKGEQQNAAITAKVQAQRVAALNSIYNAIDANASKLAAANIATNNANQKALLDSVSKNAVSYMQKIASTLGTATFENFQSTDPTQYQTLKSQTGLDDYQLRTLWNQAMPTPPKETEVVGIGENGNAVIYQSTFGENGQTHTTQYDLGIPYSQYTAGKTTVNAKTGAVTGGAGYIKGSNGEILVPDPSDPTGQTFKLASPKSPQDKQSQSVIDKNEAQAAAARAKAQGGGGTPGSKTASKQDIGTLSKEMETVKGTDGYIAPADWQKALSAWNKAGYSTTSFISNFKGYANPKDVYAGLAGNTKGALPASTKSKASTKPLPITR